MGPEKGRLGQGLREGADEAAYRQNKGRGKSGGPGMRAAAAGIQAYRGASGIFVRRQSGRLRGLQTGTGIAAPGCAGTGIRRKP